MVNLIKCFGKTNSTEIDTAASLDTLVDNITYSVYSMWTANTLPKTELIIISNNKGLKLL